MLKNWQKSAKFKYAACEFLVNFQNNYVDNFGIF